MSAPELPANTLVALLPQTTSVPQWDGAPDRVGDRQKPREKLYLQCPRASEAEPLGSIHLHKVKKKKNLGLLIRSDFLLPRDMGDWQNSLGMEEFVNCMQ